jgi:hypothetical protein
MVARKAQLDYKVYMERMAHVGQMDCTVILGPKGPKGFKGPKAQLVVLDKQVLGVILEPRVKWVQQVREVNLEKRVLRETLD